MIFFGLSEDDGEIDGFWLESFAACSQIEFTDRL